LNVSIVEGKCFAGYMRLVVILPLPLKNRLKYSRKTAGNKKAPGGAFLLLGRVFYDFMR